MLAQLSGPFFAHQPTLSRLEYVPTSDSRSDVCSACCTGDFIYGVVLFPLFDQPDNMVAGTNNNHQNLGKVLTFG